MKTHISPFMSVLTAASILGAAVCTQASGQDIASLLASPDALRTYALSQVRSGQGIITSPALNPSYPGSVTSAYVPFANTNYAELVIAELNQAQFSPDLTDTNAVVTLTSTLYDVNSNVLFLGVTDFGLTWLLGGNFPQYNYMIQPIPLPLSGVSNAVVVTTGSDGISTTNVLGIDAEGQPLLPPAFDVWGASLGIVFMDGSSTNYDLGGGSSPPCRFGWAGIYISCGKRAGRLRLHESRDDRHPRARYQSSERPDRHHLIRS